MPEKAAQYRATTARPPTGETHRASRHARGYTSRWSRFAKSYLQAHPLCVLCAEANRTTAATCVDHIDNQGPNGSRGYDPDNLRPLCTRCHNSRSAREQHRAKREVPGT